MHNTQTAHSELIDLLLLAGFMMNQTREIMLPMFPTDEIN